MQCDTIVTHLFRLVHDPKSATRSFTNRNKITDKFKFTKPWFRRVGSHGENPLPSNGMAQSNSNSK